METHQASRESIARLCREEGVEDAIAAVERRVERLLNRVQALGGLSLPVDMELVASFAGIAKVVDVPGLNTLARVRPAGPTGELVVERRAEDGRTRRRFSTGHEIGHTLFPDFWAAPVRCRPPSHHALLGQAADPVETLCELAGASLLLPERLVVPFLSGRNVDIATVMELAVAADASLTAAGRRVVDLAGRPCAMAALSLRHSKSQRAAIEQLDGQPTLPGFFGPSLPEPEFRIDYCYASPGMPFLPKEKSLSPAPFIAARDGQGVGRMLDLVELSGRETALEVSVVYAPVGTADEGDRRYLAMLTVADAPTLGFSTA